MSVHDGIDDAIRFQDADGMVDRLLQLAMILRHADGERGCIEGFGQDLERWVHPLECLGRRFIGHHAIYLTLKECLDGISSLVVAFHLGTIPLLFQLGGKTIAGSAKLNADYGALQIRLRLHLLSVFGR